MIYDNDFLFIIIMISCAQYRDDKMIYDAWLRWLCQKERRLSD